jgi:hypothetical protein
VASSSADKRSSADKSSPAVHGGVPRRELLVALVAIAAGSILTFALLLTRAVPSSGVAAAPRDASRPGRSAVATPQPSSTPTQSWSSEGRAYWTGNRRNSAAFELPAENTVPIWLNQVRPVLVVRCLSKSTQVFVVTASALKIEPQTEDHTVSFRFDDEQETTVRWPDSEEHDALFAPDGAAFAQRLVHAHSFRFGYTPHNASPVEARFQVTGLGPLLEPVAKDCGWKKPRP